MPAPGAWWRPKTFRDGALPIVLLAVAALFAAYLSEQLPIQHWLFWRFAGYWLGCLAWLLACTLLGYELMARIFGPTLGTLERLTFGLACGVLCFALAIFLLGLLHALNMVTFVALPLAFAAFGQRRASRDLTRFSRRLWRKRAPGVRLKTLAVSLVAAIAIGVLYFQILSPETFSFDVRWYHIPIAQRYALSGTVGRFEEGFWPAAFPHLLSYLYTWAFLTPRTLLFDRVELCAHIEFVLFLATLAQIPVLVRRLAPRAPAGLSWVVLLMFPGIYIYDLNLHAGADHAAGFWALPIALAFWRAWRSFHARNAALFAAMVSAAFLTKYTAVPIIIGPALALLGKALWSVARRRDRASLAALGTLVGVSLLLTSFQWLKNFVWYGDPIYPMLHRHLAVDPYLPELASRLAVLEGTGRPGSLTSEGLTEAALTTLTFSFKPNNWEFFYGTWPVFGSLFTLTLPCLPFVRGARRVVWLYALTMLGVFVWYVVSHYDRYLMAVLPWMAGAAATTFALIWRAGWLARGALLLLICIQIAWGGDTPFIRTHNLLGDSAFRRVALFLASAYERTPNRLRIYEPRSSIGTMLPRDAVVLAHDELMILGFDRNWVTDQHQALIHYARLGSPAAIHEQLAALGVSHLIWKGQSIRRDSLAEDLAFFNYALNYTVERRQFGGFSIGTLPAKPPRTRRRDYEVALYGCGRPYRSGAYDLEQLSLPVLDPGPRPQPWTDLDDLKSEADSFDFVVVDGSCRTERDPPGFVLAAMRGSSYLYVRSPPRDR